MPARTSTTSLRPGRRRKHRARRLRRGPSRSTTPKVEAAVTLYAQDKIFVTTNKVLKAVREMVRDLPNDRGGWDTIYRYVFARMHALGFKPSRSLNSFSRRVESR